MTFFAKISSVLGANDLLDHLHKRDAVSQKVIFKKDLISCSLQKYTAPLLTCDIPCQSFCRQLMLGFVGLQEKPVAVPFLARRMPSSYSALATCYAHFLLDCKVSIYSTKMVLHPRYVLDKAAHYLGFLVDMVCCCVLTTKYVVILAPLIG